MTINRKLLTAFVLILILTIALSVVALAQMRTIHGAAADIADNQVPSLIIVDDIGYLAQQHRRLQLRHALSSTREQRISFETQMAEIVTEVEDLFAEYARSYISDDQDSQLFEAALASWAAYRERGGPMPTASRLQDERLGDTFGDTATGFNQLATALDEWRIEQEQAVERAFSTSASTYRSAQVFVGAAVAVIVAGTIAILARTRRLVKLHHTSLESAVHVARAEAERAETFAHLSGRLAFATEEPEVVDVVIATLQRLLPTPWGDLLLLDRSRDGLIVAGAWGSNSPDIGTAVTLDQSSFCPGVRRGSAYYLADAADPLAVRCPAHPIVHGSLLCVPMLALGQVVGVIHLECAEPHGFDRDSQQLASRVAEQTALALANARLMRELEAQATTDALTGLSNARCFDEVRDHELAVAERDEIPLGLAMIDLDHFKKFNDAYGHPAGDEALKAFARVVRDAMRESDVVARYGGEEFAVAFRGADLETAAALAEKIRKAVEQVVVEIRPGHFVPLTASVGVSSTSVHGTDSMSLMRVVDQALYHAKDLGRNKVVVAGASAEGVGGSRDKEQALADPISIPPMKAVPRLVPVAAIE